MKRPFCILSGACLALLALAHTPLQAGNRESAIVDSAADVIEALSAIPLRGIPPAMLQDAQGVAIVPGVIKAGFVIGGRHGRGVVLVREPDGTWTNPVFVTLTGGSVGWQIGVQSTDVVLIFRTRASLDRILKGKGKVTLGADVAVAAGPVGRQAEAATDAQLKAEIYSYSRSRGLFAGVSVEGAAMLADTDADEAFYRIESIRPGDIVNPRGLPVPAAAETLKAQLTRLSGGPLVPVGPVVPVAPVGPQWGPAPLPPAPPQLTPTTAPPPLLPPPTPLPPDGSRR